MRQIVLAAGALALLAGCASGLGRPVHEVTADLGADQVQHVRVTTHSFYYEPARIVVRRGIPVELRIHNGAWFVPHNLTCRAPEAGIEIDRNVGMLRGSASVRFTPTTAGEYHFGCGVDAHAKKGMTGTFVVVEP